MIRYDNLNTFITDVCGKYADRVQFITPIKNQYPVMYDMPHTGKHGVGTNMFYSPYKGFGYYRINKAFVNIAIIPLHERETFIIKNKEVAKQMLIEEDVLVNANPPSSITKLIPYIMVKGTPCYYDNIRKTFGYDKNMVLTYCEPIGTMTSRYDDMKRKGYTHFTVLYFTPNNYNV